MKTPKVFTAAMRPTQLGPASITSPSRFYVSENSLGDLIFIVCLHKWFSNDKLTKRIILFIHFLTCNVLRVSAKGLSLMKCSIKFFLETVFLSNLEVSFSLQLTAPPPNIMTSKNMTAAPGDRVTLTCTVFSPNPGQTNVRWFQIYKGLPLISSRRKQIVTDRSGQTITSKLIIP